MFTIPKYEMYTNAHYTKQEAQWAYIAHLFSPPRSCKYFAKYPI